jgi:hypothetical protein
MGRFVRFKGVMTQIKYVSTCIPVLFVLTSRFQDGIYPDSEPGGFNRTSGPHDDVAAPTDSYP